MAILLKGTLSIVSLIDNISSFNVTDIEHKREYCPLNIVYISSFNVTDIEHKRDIFN